MPEFLKLGLRRGDPWIAFDGTRGLAKVDVAHARGIALEEIPPNSIGEKIAVVVVVRGWREFYFVRDRMDWTTENFFLYAEELLMKKGVTEP